MNVWLGPDVPVWLRTVTAAKPVLQLMLVV